MLSAEELARARNTRTIDCEGLRKNGSWELAYHFMERLAYELEERLTREGAEEMVALVDKGDGHGKRWRAK